jgi:uncharacterized membrane protein
MGRSRPRLVLSVLVGVLVAVLLPGPPLLQVPTRGLLAWNAGAGLYLALAWSMMRSTSVAGIRRRALQQDDGRGVMLALVVGAAAAVLLAVGSQLAILKDLPGPTRPLHAALAALTVISSWLFTQSLMALHYAHDFYLARQHRQPDPLVFPGTSDPVYLDFLYFSCVIGTSGQTADVVFQGSGLRGIGTLHCVLAFFFNATLLALAINIAAGLL